MNPLAGGIAVEAARREAHSALPHAPVAERPPPRPGRSRRLLARAFRSLADRIEPPGGTEQPLRPCAR
ncbi:hypothetical protein [Streptomyces meridianus]|uniref:Uncharacterized protein n=1 Tax=Streptomyces meridianus TaxID=2938945 RepID=A0ABT0XFA4_9ACTN|nr:hypothetical protein [Streptomyces meridianus]MCM2580487.1 hypothetical protein [Streptomyces meridianus]